MLPTLGACCPISRLRSALFDRSAQDARRSAGQGVPRTPRANEAWVPGSVERDSVHFRGLLMGSSRKAC